ncbi:HAD hydrolase-like protein [Kribbella sp. NPDC051718]|uniref:HAD family hydrolase n=1 Tax=Kribbella sp. NPDC051718 TaxID=3155168 RepID=UPI00342E3654
MNPDPLAQTLNSAEAVLFDFDGPIWSVFDGYPAPQITRELLGLARRIRGELAPAREEASSPHELLLAAAPDLELAQRLEAALQRAELEAIETAKPTLGAAESVAACTASGRLVAVVSNNYALAVNEYLARTGLAKSVTYVEGRNPADPKLMKPDPHLPQRAISVIGIRASSCVFVGDQTTDIGAGQAAGIPTIGYANKPGKVESLKGAGADAVLTTMLDLASALC